MKYESPGLHSPCHVSGILMSCLKQIYGEDVAQKKKSSPGLHGEQIFPTSASRFPSSSCVVTVPAARRLEAVQWIKRWFRPVFLIGLLPNLINCENVVGGMAQPLVAPRRVSQAPIRAPKSQITKWCHAFHKYSAVVILFGAPRCSDSRDLYNVSVCKKKWKQSGEKNKKNNKLRRHCIYLGNITPWNDHMLTYSGQSVSDQTGTSGP